MDCPLGHLLQEPRETAAAARHEPLHDQLVHRLGTAVAVDPDALVELETPAGPGDEVPVAAVGKREARAAAVLGERHLDARADVEAHGIRHLALLALAPGGNQQVLAAQLGTVVAQKQDAAMDEAEAPDIAVVAGLDPRRVAAAL